MVKVSDGIGVVLQRAADAFVKYGGDIPLNVVGVVQQNFKFDIIAIAKEQE